MNIQASVSFLQNADQVLDYIPLISTVSSLFQIFQKCILFAFVSVETINKNRYFQLVNNKPLLRCVVLLVPLFGNFIVAFYDLKKKEDLTIRYELDQKLKKLKEEIFDKNQLLDKEKKVLESYKIAVKAIEAELKCAKCAEIALLPYVIGISGDVLCEPCLKGFISENETNKNFLPMAPIPILPNSILIGNGFPIPTQKNIAEAILDLKKEKGLQLSERYLSQEAYKPHIDTEYALVSKFFLTTLKVKKLLKDILNESKVGIEDWSNGVFIHVEKDLGFYFFSAFSTFLNEQPIGKDRLNVLIDIVHYRLAVQLVVNGKYLKAPENTNHKIIEIKLNMQLKLTSVVDFNKELLNNRKNR